MDLFVYGTLMADDLVAQLTGQRLRKDVAVLDGYRKEVAPDAYPRLILDPAGRVHGFLLRDVGADALRAFDRYEDEGHLYRRTTVTVTVGGLRQAAMTYVRLP